MPTIRVRLFANLREYTNTKELEIEGETVNDILLTLCNRFPGLENMLFSGDNINSYIHIFLNGKDIRDSGGPETVLAQEDEIAIFPPVSGGACSRKE